MKKQFYKITIFALTFLMVFMLSSCKNDMGKDDGNDSGTAGVTTDTIIGSESAVDTTVSEYTDPESDTVYDMTDKIDSDNAEDDDIIGSESDDNGIIGDAISDIANRDMLRRNMNDRDTGEGLFPPETNFGQSSRPGTL